MFAVFILARGYVILYAFTTTKKERKMAMTLSNNILNDSSRTNREARIGLAPMYNDRCFSCCAENDCQVREAV